MAAIPIKLDLFQPEDYQDYLSLTMNAEIMKMVTGCALGEPESRARFELILQQNQLVPGYGTFKIINMENQQFVGLAKLVMEQPGDNEVEIGFILLEAYQGKGIASAATRELIEFVRKDPSIVRVKAILDPNNKASRKILVGEGFVSDYVGEMDGLPGEIMELVL